MAEQKLIPISVCWQTSTPKLTDIALRHLDLAIQLARTGVDQQLLQMRRELINNRLSGK